MGKYSKTYSNYVLRKRHQTTTDGSIFERDWGTLGERHVIESGKRKIYADSNFLFTDNNLKGTKKRNNTGEWSAAYTEDNLSSTVNNNSVNDISILSPSTDLRDYAYFGSALELIRSSIEHIVKWFPARVWATTDGVVRDLGNGQYSYLDKIVTDGHHNYAAKYISYESVVSGSDTIKMFRIQNPFAVDLHSSNSLIGEDENAMRYMSYSWQQYVVNGSALTSWTAWSKPYDVCDSDYTVLYEIEFTYNGNCVSTRTIDDDDCCITFADSTVDCVTFAASDDCISNTCTGHIYGLKLGSYVIWCTDIEGLVLQPTVTVQEDYFNNLTDFEALLLSRDTDPKYKVTLLTPLPYPNNGQGYYYVNRDYIWPSIGYCISVDTIGFDDYVSRLYKLGSLMDELWCDNIWRNMTHEAIKNFDWTYTREYIEGEEADNIAGGTRMQAVLRIMGAEFDGIKRYIDAIGKKNIVSYDGYGNIAPAELSDKCELQGWEVYSTKENMDDNIELGTDYVDTITKLPDRWGGTGSVAHGTWFDSLNCKALDQNTVDNRFMSRLLLNSGGIFRAKGTKQGIEEVMALFGFGNNEFSFTERYYSVVPKRCTDVFYHYVRAHGEDISSHTYTDITSQYSSFEKYLKGINYKVDYDSMPYVRIGDEFYMLTYDDTYEDFVLEYNELKNIAYNYEDDDFSGLPLKKVYINNDWYIVPYFTQDKIYDGDVQFETNGGWGKFVESGDDITEKGKLQYDYLETLPYMEVLQNVSELLTINAYYIGSKRIYYVMDLTDLSDYIETIPTTISHFFKLVDSDEPQLFASWKNVPTNTTGMSEIEYNSYCNLNDLFIGVTYDDYKLCQYYDSLVLNNLGNNPHVGYASYDLGKKYRDYVEEPFKYVAENYGFTDLEDCEIVKQFHYQVTEYQTDKLVNRVNDSVPEDQLYYLPSKMLIITNKMTMSGESKENFISYFKNVILKYIMQVIPSTTLFILKDF